MTVVLGEIAMSYLIGGKRCLIVNFDRGCNREKAMAFVIGGKRLDFDGARNRRNSNGPPNRGKGAIYW